MVTVHLTTQWRIASRSIVGNSKRILTEKKQGFSFIYIFWLLRIALRSGIMGDCFLYFFFFVV